MARIRSIKPEFFRHEALQDLEIAHPGKYPMLVFEGLWGHCDSKGRFEWRPRQLKLDILPFLPFEMADTLDILANAGQVEKYEVDGREYGLIPSFERHQRISGKEATDGERFPNPLREASEKQQGSNGDEPESQEGKGMEKEGNGVNQAPDKPARFDPAAVELPCCIPATSWIEWIAYRRERKLTCTERTIRAQIENLTAWANSGHMPASIIKDSIDNGWQGLFEPKARGSPTASRADERAKVGDVLTGRVGNERGGNQERDITGECQRVA